MIKETTIVFLWTRYTFSRYEATQDVLRPEELQQQVSRLSRWKPFGKNILYRYPAHRMVRTQSQFGLGNQCGKKDLAVPAWVGYA